MDVRVLGIARDFSTRIYCHAELDNSTGCYGVAVSHILFIEFFPGGNCVELYENYSHDAEITSSLLRKIKSPIIEFCDDCMVLFNKKVESLKLNVRFVDKLDLQRLKCFVLYNKC